MNTIEVLPGEHINLCTVRADAISTLTAELSNLRDDYTAQGEMLAGANSCVMELESQVAEATRLIATLRETLRDVEQSRAIQRQALQAVKDQLRDARDENNDLHAALSKARRASDELITAESLEREGWRVYPLDVAKGGWSAVSGNIKTTLFLVELRGDDVSVAVRWFGTNQVQAPNCRTMRDLNTLVRLFAHEAVAILPGDGFASEKQTDTRPAIEQLAYPDAELAREAGVSEKGEGNE